MEKPAVSSPEQVKRLLELGCAYNTPLTIVAETRDFPSRYKSRMLDLSEDPDDPHVIIDQPVADGPAIALKRDIRITLYFNTEEGRFSFDARILNRTTFTLGAQNKVAALQITFPKHLMSGQRRRYFRVDVPLGKPLSVECAITADIEKLVTGESDSWDFAQDQKFKGRIVNISVGGVLLALDEKNKKLPKIGTVVVSKFALPEENEPIILKGIIRRHEHTPSTTEYRAGIEFIETEDLFECKLAVNRLYKYVAQRQREMLQAAAQ